MSLSKKQHYCTHASAVGWREQAREANISNAALVSTITTGEQSGIHFRWRSMKITITICPHDRNLQQTKRSNDHHTHIYIAELIMLACCYAP